jgi:hypothetical protein
MFYITISESGMLTYQIASIGCFLFMLPIIKKCKSTFGSEIQTKLFQTTIGFFLLFILTDVIMKKEKNDGRICRLVGSTHFIA